MEFIDKSLKTIKGVWPNSIADAVNHVDTFCSTHINGTIEFLDKHPGIAMALSPSTVLRRCAQKHIDQKLNINY